MSHLSYRRHRFPAPIIQPAIWLYLRFTLSYRDVEDLLAERGLSDAERTYGGLPPAARRRLRALTAEIEAKRANAFDPAVVLRPGTRLVREWRGMTHTVIVLDDGFEYLGEGYRSFDRDREADHRRAIGRARAFSASADRQ